ncbi:hypothetical protein ABH13_1844 [Bacillus velezensis]|nr:hypothetical protein ABH13_1844 [Bacillus velezensis]EJD66084.1 hypothetical protein BB65665_18227 [Bacillus sp. 916]
MHWISFIHVLAQLSGMSMSGYVVSEWGGTRHFGLGAASVFACLS